MSITQKFAKDLTSASQTLKKWKNAGGNYFNVFYALGLGRKENYHSLFIAYLLDKDKEHYQSIFVEKFLAKLKKENIPSLNFANLSAENLKSVESEAVTEQSKQNRRMDLLLTFENNIHIIIENKIGAPDQSAQIKAYVEEIHKKKKGLSEKQKYQSTLVIYLHPDDIDPSELSFGKTSARVKKHWSLDKDGRVIRDENGTIKAYFLKIDYKWIKSWVQECVKWFEKQATSKREKGFDKIIAVLNQYIEIIEWRVTYEWQDSDPVAEFVLENPKNQTIALEIMRDKNHDLHEIVENSWGAICERVVENFYKELLKPFENEKGARVGKYTWKAYRTDDELGKTGWQIVFYKKERGLNLDYVMAFAFVTSNFRKSYFAYGCPYYYAEGYEKLVAGCEKFFTPKNKGVRKDGDCYYKYIFDEKDDKEYAFAEWIIEKGEKVAVDEFKAKFAEFIELDAIKEVMSKVENYIDNELKNSK